MVIAGTDPHCASLWQAGMSEMQQHEATWEREHGDSVVGGYVAISDEALHYVHPLPPPVMKKDNLFF